MLPLFTIIVFSAKINLLYLLFFVALASDEVKLSAKNFSKNRDFDDSGTQLVGEGEASSALF